MPTIRQSSATNAIYDEIKSRIINVYYFPGFKLSESRLASEFNTGRSPIRSAFARLHSEGWIEVSPQSGTYVRKLSEQEIAEIFEYRLILEVNAIRLATKNISDKKLIQLRQAFNRLRPKKKTFSAGLKTFDSFNELDSLFHTEIYRAAGNSLIKETLLSLHDKVRWLKKLSPSTPARMRDLFAELELILQALENRNPSEGAKSMRRHIENAADFGSDLRATSANSAEK